MKVDLGDLHYQMAINMVKWCYEHDIDKEKCAKFVAYMSTAFPDDFDFTLDIPESHVTYFLLKWA